MSDEPNPTWTHVIRSHRGWLDLDLRELWRYRDLGRMFVRRDFVAVYKQTILGPLWFLVGPLGSSLVFTLVFGRIVGIPTAGIPPFLFYLSGTTCWSYLSSCVSGTSTTFTANAGLFGKVYFPRLITPVSTIVSNLLGFSIQLLALLAIVVVFVVRGSDVRLGWHLLFFPLPVVQLGLLGLAIGLIVSSLTVKYRDFAYLLGFGMQLWLYASPIIYPLTAVPDHLRGWYSLNPVVGVLGLFRHAVLGTECPVPAQLATSWGITLALLVTGVLLFNRTEKSFMDVV